MKSRLRRFCSAFCACIALCTVAGCASYDAKNITSVSMRGTSVKEFATSVDGVDVRCCPLVDREASQKYLGIDPSSAGVIPIFLSIRNNTDSPLKVEVGKCFTATDSRGGIFNALTIGEASERARRSDVVPVVWSSMIFGVAGMIIAGNQVAEVNRTIDQDYHEKSFKPTLINSGFEGKGIIFFDVPKEEQTSITSLVLTTTNLNTMEHKETTLEFLK